MEDIYNSIIAILIHIFLIFLAEGLIYYIYIIPKITTQLYGSIYENMIKNDSNVRLFLYYIFSSLYNSNKLYNVAHNENKIINYDNNVNIVIYSVLLVSLFLIIVGLIIYVKYRLSIEIKWKFIIFVAILSFLMISIYELIFIYTVYTQYKPNEEKYSYNILNTLYTKYNNPKYNYDQEINALSGLIKLN